MIGDSIPYNDPAGLSWLHRVRRPVRRQTCEGHRSTRSRPRTCPSTTGSRCRCSWTSWSLVQGAAEQCGRDHRRHRPQQLRPEWRRACGTTSTRQRQHPEGLVQVTARCAVSRSGVPPPVRRDVRHVASWRDGRPTILRTIDKYNDWIGLEDAHLTPDQVQRTVFMHDAWNKMLCESAETPRLPLRRHLPRLQRPNGAKPSGDLLAGDYTHPSDGQCTDRPRPGRAGVRTA